MRDLICNHEFCTGCSACRDVCPKSCITMCQDELKAVYPVIDESNCVDCGKCKKICPSNHAISLHTTDVVYAAWSKNPNIRRTSASGGVAYELQANHIKNGGVSFGVIYERNKGCFYNLITNENEIALTQNSKYTFSETNGIYKVVKKKLDENINVLFIGVPCQVAGLYAFLNKDYENLTTVDIICHGMPPADYLQQHIEYIEKTHNEQAKSICFRDPDYNTYTYTFTLRNFSNKVFYKKKVYTQDNYQLGYHKSLIYRENCYNCKYARNERVGDLTIGDFSGLGKEIKWQYDYRNVSCILVNTNKGKQCLQFTDKIVCVKRPKSEAFKYENQLIRPSIPHVGRNLFVDEFKKCGNFEEACNVALKKDKHDIRWRKGMLKQDIICIMFHIIPRPVKELVKYIKYKT